MPCKKIRPRGVESSPPPLDPDLMTCFRPLAQSAASVIRREKQKPNSFKQKANTGPKVEREKVIVAEKTFKEVLLNADTNEELGVRYVHKMRMGVRKIKFIQ